LRLIGQLHAVPPAQGSVARMINSITKAGYQSSFIKIRQNYKPQNDYGL